MTWSISWVYPIRIAQAVFAIIVLGLTAYVVSDVDGGSTVNFLLFNGIWTAFITIPYLALAPIYFPNLAHRFIVMVMEAVTMIFWFAGFIALGAELPPAHHCHGGICSSLQATTVFGAFTWALFAATTVIALLAVLRPNRSSTTQKPATQTTVHTGV